MKTPSDELEACAECGVLVFPCDCQVTEMRRVGYTQALLKARAQDPVFLKREKLVAANLRLQNTLQTEYAELRRVRNQAELADKTLREFRGATRETLAAVRNIKMLLPSPTGTQAQQETWDTIKKNLGNAINTLRNVEHK